MADRDRNESWINRTDLSTLDRIDFSEFVTISPLHYLFENVTMTSGNMSSQNHHHQQQPWITMASRVIPLYSLIFLLAVIGNSLVIMTLVQNKRMRTVTNLFLLNLAISDLLLGIFCMPITLLGMLLRDFIFGEIMCKLLPYLQGLYCYHLNFIFYTYRIDSSAHPLSILRMNG